MLRKWFNFLEKLLRHVRMLFNFTLRLKLIKAINFQFYKMNTYKSWHACPWEYIMKIYKMAFYREVGKSWDWVDTKQVIILKDFEMIKSKYN